MTAQLISSSHTEKNIKLLLQIVVALRVGKCNYLGYFLGELFFNHKLLAVACAVSHPRSSHLF